MTSISEYTFNNIGRIGADKNDNSQRNLSNTKHLNYSLANHYSANSSDSHVKFATSNLGISYKNSLGGLPGNMVDFDSSLSIKKDSDRHFEKLQLHQRPFASVPYLGRGGLDADIESKLMQGESISERKSASTVMEKQYIDYNEYPLMHDVKSRINDPTNSIEELALEGWTRGGLPTRDMNNDKKK
jgi:hypothetical protein